MHKLVTGLSLVLLSATAWAHKPSYSEGQYRDSASAWTIEDPDVSIVLYHPVECSSQVVWLRYEVPEAREIFVQLGVPKIDRLADYEPNLAFVHSAGETPQDVPFTPPEGYGVDALELDEERQEFFEPFTQTESWILLERKVQVPAGVGYVAAWHPEGRTGKLWVAVGDVEEFGEQDWADIDSWYYNTRYFHELIPEGEPPATAYCEPPADAITAGGCSTSVASSALLLASLALLRRRRKR
ncbi:MAG TPA: hypothetical protein DEB46_11875 [Myxococcales bacterium]|nr:hypothetical protein [Myxococcales bacterium]HBU48998.1 hypothetical protein [Myxococcales bacterium]